MDKLDFIGSAEPNPAAVVTPEPQPASEPAPTPEPAPEAAPPEPQGQPRDEHGRFTTPQQEQPLAEPAPAQGKPPPGYVPVSAVQAERAQRQALEEQLRAYQEAQQYEEPPAFDPEAFVQQQREEFQRAQLANKLNVSEMLARRTHGDQAVEAALQWSLQRYEANPAFRTEVLTNSDPYEYAIRAYQLDQRNQLLADVSTDDLAAFRAWKAQMAPAATAQQPAPVGAPPSPVPTPSLASAPSAAGAAHVATGPGTAFGGLFKGP